MEFVEQVKSSADIVTVIGEYVRLRKTGAAARYTGLCPFHTEKTPSFSVHATHQFYKCFGCGAGGDVFKFVMEIERLTFWEALKLLAEKYGIPLPKRNEYADEEARRRGRIFEMHEIAARVFSENLHGPAGEEARAYLQRRGVSPAIAAEFGLGLADRGGQSLTRLFERQNFTPEELESGGLALKRQDGSGFFDRFRGRLMFPIHNESGKVIAFGGRALAPGDEPKYLNSPETAIYRKSYVLYNLHRAKEAIRKNGRGILVEGYMDVIGVYAAGFREVVASCGTALTSFQVRSLKRHSEHVVVNFDPDDAGVNATERSIQTLLEEQIKLKVLQLEGSLDPDEFIKTNGREAYEHALARSRGYFHWLADRGRARFDVSGPEGRVELFRFLIPAIHRMPDKVERAAVVNDVADYLRIAPGLVLEEFKRAAIERREQRPVRVAPPSIPPTERLLLKALLTNPEARAEILPVLRRLPAVERFQIRPIFDAVFRLADAGEPVSFSTLEPRLDETERALLHSLLLADEEREDHVSFEQAMECLRRLGADEQRSRRDHLRTRIREAERAGNLEEALALSRELSGLDRA